MAQQQPAPTPTPRTGRAYSAPDLPKTPPPAGPQAASPVTFTDVTAQTRITFKHAASATSQKYLLETMGAGVAMLDYDNDGRLDLFFTNGAQLKDPMGKGDVPDKRNPRYWNRLYQQKPDDTFIDITEQAGLKGEGYSMGAAVGDYDNDGYVDLYVTGYGENHLYHNNGNGAFSDVTRKLGVSAGGWSTSAGWFDYDRDGRLDLFIARYLDWDFEKGSIFCGEARPGGRAFCHPDNFKGVTNLLYHQLPDGTFEEVTTKAGMADPSGKALGVAFADFDNDGLLDVFVANDSVRQSLYRNNDDGTFEDVAVMAGAGYDENGKTFAGMGVDAADFENDGHMDVVMSVVDGPPVVLRNKGSKNHWLGVRLAAMKNRDGFGPRITVVDGSGRRHIFDVNNAGSYLSSNDSRVVVGLGNAVTVRTVEVRWPNGQVEKIANPTIDRYLTINDH